MHEQNTTNQNETNEQQAFTPDEVLDVAGVCHWLHVGKKEVYRAVHEGRLPVMRFGKNGQVWRFMKQDLLKLRA